MSNLAAIVTDQHFGCRGDSISMLEYQKKFYSEVFFPTIEKLNIKTIFDLGDTFDKRKHIDYRTLSMTKEMWFDVIRDKCMTLHSLVGNHTTYHKNTNEVNAQSLILSEYPNVSVYDLQPKHIEISDKKIALVPWINNQSYAETVKFLNESNADVVFGHFELSGFLMHRGHICDGGMDSEILKKFKLVCSGHFHEKSNQGDIHYLGAPYEMTWSDYHSPRGFHVLDLDDLSLTFHRNPHRMFVKLLYDDSRAEKPEDCIPLDIDNANGAYVKVILRTKDNPYFFDLFLEKVYDQNPLAVQIVDDHRNADVLDDTEMMAQAEDTSTIIRKYVDNSSYNNKDSLALFLHQLYLEALSMEAN